MIVTKATATVTPVESSNPNGEFDVILSTNGLDRDGDELQSDEWKTPLPDHITFDSDHGMSVATTVGSGKPFINDHGQLQVRGTFASTPHAQDVRTLVNEGHIKTTSVAYIERKAKGQKDAKPQRELLNGAFVAVPANPEAVILSSKSANIDVDEKTLQWLHDATCQAGAKCVSGFQGKTGTHLGGELTFLSPTANVAVAAMDELMTPKSSSRPAGSPQETAEESAAETAEPAEKSAGSAVDAADESAESVAMRAKALAIAISATALAADTDNKE